MTKKTIVGALCALVLSTLCIGQAQATSRSGMERGAEIKIGGIDTAKIGGGAVDTGKILAAAVTNVKIADSAIDTLKLRQASVTGDKLAPLSVDTSKISAGAIDTSKLLPGIVDSGKLRSTGASASALCIIPSGAGAGAFGHCTNADATVCACQ